MSSRFQQIEDYIKNLAFIVVDSYNDRLRFLKSEYADDFVSRENWYKWIFRIYYDVDQVRGDNPNYMEYLQAIDEHMKYSQLSIEERYLFLQQQQKEREQQQKELEQQTQQRRQRLSSIRQRQPQEKLSTSSSDEAFYFPEGSQDDKGATGSGINTRGSNLVTCPESVIANVDRLEILVGGKRAVNNSSEIINEITSICQRVSVTH